MPSPLPTMAMRSLSAASLIFWVGAFIGRPLMRGASLGLMSSSSRKTDLDMPLAV